MFKRTVIFSCSVAGWGQTAFTTFDSPTAMQKQVTVPIVPTSTCVQSMTATIGAAAVSTYLDQVQNICAGGVAMKDACTVSTYNYRYLLYLCVW